MQLIVANSKINLQFGLTPRATEMVQDLFGGNQILETRTHDYLIKWYRYEIKDSVITVFEVPVLEIESVIRIVNGYID